MDTRIYFDTETCGFHGPIVLLQYCEGLDGEIILYNPWEHTIKSTLTLMEKFIYHQGGIVGFNLAYDVFHFAQMYTTLRLMNDCSELLCDCIKEYAAKEKDARFGPCIKFKHVLDLMLHARKTRFQSTMNRDDILIRKVPTVVAQQLCDELNKRTDLEDIYFAKKSNVKQRWTIVDTKTPEFKNLVLRFAPSTSLKALACHILGYETAAYDEITLPSRLQPIELGYAPFAEAVGEGAWPSVILAHIAHWNYNQKAREYAYNDVLYTRELDKYFNHPEMDDVDSVLACALATIRWRGYKIDIEKIIAYRNNEENKVKEATFRWASIEACKNYLAEALSPQEKCIIEDRGTGKPVLEELSKWQLEETCKECSGLGCETCKYEGTIKTGIPHPVAERAQALLNIRRSFKRVELFDKLLKAGRFHASFNVIGTKSSRMSGSDDLNAQGINKTATVRALFPLADEGWVLCGGDFDSFEIYLMDAAYADPVMHAELLADKKLHGVMGTFLFPGHDYNDILATAKLEGEQNLYSRSKQSVFALCYGGNSSTLVRKSGVDDKVAEKAYSLWCDKYKVWAQARNKIFDMFCSMRQPKGIGTKVEWHEPADYIESMFGFRRYFTLENKICKMLFDLANNLPKEFSNVATKLTRRDREQTVVGCCRSALYACAFQIQAANMRAAANHVIQSSGATLTKKLQALLWTYQPFGVHEFQILPMNVHDEIMAPMKPEIVDQVKKAVDDFIAEHSKAVPLLAMTWKTNMKSWADK